MSSPDFARSLADHGLAPLRRGPAAVLQVNIGRRCDLACHHCHVEAGPNRTENMDAATAERVLELLERNPGLGTLDLTGGAPELNENFRRLVRSARGEDLSSAILQAGGDRGFSAHHRQSPETAVEEEEGMFGRAVLGAWSPWLFARSGRTVMSHERKLRCALTRSRLTHRRVAAQRAAVFTTDAGNSQCRRTLRLRLKCP